MKIRVNLWLTIFLFLVLLIASAASSYIGYFMGREALKVVTQPDVNSERDSTQKPLGGEHKGLEIIEEDQILREVYDVVNGKR